MEAHGTPADPPVAVHRETGATAPPSARRPLRHRLLLLGPAFVAAIAYVDPGNFATNFSAGSSYGYLLLWVIVAANLMAMLIQSLSAKLGLATGRNLCEVSRQEFPRPVVWALWVQAEIVAMATDIAEVLGGAIALNLLFGLPLLYGGVVTAAVAFVLAGMHSRGYRRFELAIGGLFAVIILGFLVNLASVDIDAPAAVAGLVPAFAGIDSVLLATGILGATVMPHAIYLHSALTQDSSARPPAPPRVRLRYQRLDIVLAMGLAGLVNISMLVTAAGLFHAPGTGSLAGTDTLAGVHASLTGIDRTAAVAFALALLASGLASSGVGTLAGQVVLQGYLRRRVPLLLRRALTVAPALIVLAIGIEPTQALVLSQVVLSFGIPFALVPLVLLTRRRDLMGDFVNRPATSVCAGIVAAVIIALNAFLLVQMTFGSGTG